MNISQNCLDLIKKEEGFRANAYLDPVSIPTIGCGTIRYPNRQKIQKSLKNFLKVFLLQILHSEIGSKEILFILKSIQNNIARSKAKND